MLQPKLISVQPLDHLKLRLEYETGEVKLFDVSPYAIGSWFGELKEEKYFRTVRLLPGGIGIEWDNGQDIAPHELYESSTPIAGENRKAAKNGQIKTTSKLVVCSDPRGVSAC